RGNRLRSRITFADVVVFVLLAALIGSFRLALAEPWECHAATPLAAILRNTRNLSQPARRPPIRHITKTLVNLHSIARIHRREPNRLTPRRRIEQIHHLITRRRQRRRTIPHPEFRERVTTRHIELPTRRRRNTRRLLHSTRHSPLLRQTVINAVHLLLNRCEPRRRVARQGTLPSLIRQATSLAHQLLTLLHQRLCHHCSPILRLIMRTRARA